MVAPPPGTVIVRLRRLYASSARSDHMNDVPVCGSNGPARPLWYSAAGQLSNCGKLSAGSVTLRKSPVAMNDEFVFWFCALSAPLKLQVSPLNGSSIPDTSNGSPVSGSLPPPAVVMAAPNMYSIGSPCELPEPSRARQPARTAGSALHCRFSNGS